MGSRVLGPSLVLTLAAALVVPSHAQQGWQPYEFEAGERYRYELKWIHDGASSAGHFALHVQPASAGRLKILVEGKLGDSECSSAATVESAQAVPQQLMMSCMMLAPAMMLLAGPSIGYLAGRDLSDSDEWSFSHGGESMSFRVEGSCSHAGQSGKLAVMRHNGEVRMKSCVGKNLAMPLAVILVEEQGDSMEAKLVAYGR